MTDVSPVAAVKIEWSADSGGSWNEIAAAAPNTGTFVWTTPNVSGVDVPTYKLRITAVDGAAATLGDAGHETVFTSDAFTLTETPAAATGLAANDPDASATGLTGADFHLSWTPSASTDVTAQSIYLLPEGVAFDAASQSPLVTFADRTTADWTGSAGITTDSAHAALDPSVHYLMYVLSKDASAAQAVSAGAAVAWPAAPTAVVASDVDASAGVTLADVRATWVPSTSAGVVQQAIYVLPSGSTLVLAGGSPNTPVATLTGNSDTQWQGSGTVSPALDSAGHPLSAGAYSVWVVAVDEDGHEVASAPAGLTVVDP